MSSFMIFIILSLIKFYSFFCRNFTNVDQKGFVDTIRSSSHLPYASKEGYNKLQQQWLSFLVGTSIPFLVLRGYSIPNLVFCVQFESSKHQWKQESVTHKWMPYATRSFLYLPYTSKGGNEPLHQPLTHILAVYQSLFHAERVTPNLAFLSNLIVAISRNDAM